MDWSALSEVFRGDCNREFCFLDMEELSSELRAFGGCLGV